MAVRRTSRKGPERITDREYSFGAFSNGKAFPFKRNGGLPAMGWNSWNAFGSGNTQYLTRQMADAMVRLELDKAGYTYLVLDDGCYKAQRVDERLSNEEVKFPDGFKALSDYVHERGLKFGMYNDIGTNLCAGAAVGTCGHEDLDAESYVEWGVDFLKVDNCYYPWDNATFSDKTNARYTYAPNIRSVRISGKGIEICRSAEDGLFEGQGGYLHRNGYGTNIGTFDGTNTGVTPIGERSGELVFALEAPDEGRYALCVEYATGQEEGVGEWLQIAVGEGEEEIRYFDGLLPPSKDPEAFLWSGPVEIFLKKGGNLLRLMNHRRQENVLNSYAALAESLDGAKPGNDIVLSICEWGKTQPHNWGYKVGNSWRILNDITFQVGADGDPGRARWASDGTDSITSQYNKAVVMDEFSGPDRGWNDPDMLVIGMEGISLTMSRTHMSMWCMMNAPLMLGMDLRRVEKGDELWKIMANREVIALNQDPLGVQAKRIYCSLEEENPDTVYITNNDRVDILAKPLSDGDVALLFVNVSEKRRERETAADVNRIVKYIGHKMTDRDGFLGAQAYRLTDLWTGSQKEVRSGIFSVPELEACGCVAYRIRPLR